MHEMMTLRKAGIAFPNVDVLQRVTELLSGPRRRPVSVYGGYLRDLLLLGHVRDTGDMDAAMFAGDFLALKPEDKDAVDVRKQFVLHEPHLLFMIHQYVEDVFVDNERPFVLALKAEHRPMWGLDVPLGLTLTRYRMTPYELAKADLGFSEIAWDGQEIWVTEAFVEDYRNKTFTLTRCRDARDFERTLRRVMKFQAGRYPDWRFIFPEHFREFADAA